MLMQGVEVWNKWREENPKTKPNLSCANLHGLTLNKAQLCNANLDGANLSRADLGEAILIGASLKKANLSNADLTAAALMEAKMNNANLTNAQLTGTDILDADLTGANLRGANLACARFINVSLKNANITDCRIYGIAAWEVELRGAKQSNLVITDKGAPTITVDNLEVAQFIYLLLKNSKIRDVINTVAKKGVLILGRFSNDRKRILDAIAQRLRELDYLPIMFDFAKPTNRDFSETVMILAGMSKFIIADITQPRSVPQESQITVPNFMVPFIPIIQKGEQSFSMFSDLQNKYDWVLETMEYRNKEELIKHFITGIINPALKKYNQLSKRKMKAYRKPTPISRISKR